MKSSKIILASLALAVSTMAGVGTANVQAAPVMQAESTISTTTDIVLDDWFVPSGESLTGKVVVKDQYNRPVVGAPVYVGLVDAWRVYRDRDIGTTNSQGELYFNLSTPDYGYYDVYAETSAFGSYSGSISWSSVEFGY